MVLIEDRKSSPNKKIIVRNIRVSKLQVTVKFENFLMP